MTLQMLDEMVGSPDFIYDPSLVLYLPLWKKDGTIIASEDAYGHTCTVTGATGGLAGWGLQGRTFDGIDDVVTVTYQSALQITTAITLEEWVKVLVIPATDHKGTLITKADNYYFTIDPNGKFCIYLIGVSTIHDPSTTAVTVNVWYHLAITWDGSNINWYMNGRLDGTLALPGTATSGTNNLGLGGQIGNATRWLNGIIGEVQIYNRALSVGEIQQIYQATKWRY